MKADPKTTSMTGKSGALARCCRGASAGPWLGAGALASGGGSNMTGGGALAPSRISIVGGASRRIRLTIMRKPASA